MDKEPKLDKERKLEEEILASFERGEWQPSPKGKSEIARFAAMASASLAKDKRVNIRISSRDLDDIQAKAAEYVTGRLVEPKTGLTPRARGTRQKRRSP